MPGFDGTGPRGMGPMTGGGRGFCSPWGIGAAFRGGMPTPYPRTPYPSYGSRGATPFYGGYGAYGSPGAMPSYGGYAPGASPFAPQMTREQELDFLRNQADIMKGQLEQIEARINELAT